MTDTIYFNTCRRFLRCPEYGSKTFNDPLGPRQVKCEDVWITFTKTIGKKPTTTTKRQYDGTTYTNISYFTK